MRVMEAHNDLPTRDNPIPQQGREMVTSAITATNRVWASIWANQRPANEDVRIATYSPVATAHMLGTFQTRLYQLNERLETAEKKAAKYDALVEALGEVGEAVTKALKR
jgi:hypothetical protein